MAGFVGSGSVELSRTRILSADLRRRPLWSGTPRKQLLVILRVGACRSLTVRSPNW